MIPEETRREIMRRIANAEQEHDVSVLFAIESGSRAWGFESPNSDFDVRFIYAHKKNWYLTIDLETKNDVIEYPIVDEIDINGWDIRKALQLFTNSNPVLIEWLQSPIVYVDNGFFSKGVQSLISETYKIEKGIYHYRSMANKTFKTHLQNEKVYLKKYFYALRPLLAVQWLEKFQTPAPVEFVKLRQLIEPNSDLDNEIKILLERKKQSLEKELILPNKFLNNFIENELNRLEAFNIKPEIKNNSTEKLNQLFQKQLDFLN